MKNTTSWIVGLILLISVSFASYKIGQKSVQTQSSETSIEEKVKTDLINLTQKDFEEYKNLKTMEDRYKKADEILGKIVLVYLADLGLKLGYTPSNPALLDGTCAIPGLVPAATPVVSSTPQQSNMSAAPAPLPSPTPSSPAWIQNEQRLANLSREEDMLSNLKKNPIEDLFSTLKSSADISHEEGLSIEGRFQGEIQFFNQKEHPTDWILYWEVALKSNNLAKGSSLITLTKKSDNKTFSRSSSSSGQLENFVRPVGSKALIVNVYGDDGYIQIYPAGNNDHWVGNYYEKGKIGQYVFAGQVVLNRLQ